jgi:hypothetical protein
MCLRASEDEHNPGRVRVQLGPKPGEKSDASGVHFHATFKGPVGEQFKQGQSYTVTVESIDPPAPAPANNSSAPAQATGQASPATQETPPANNSSAPAATTEPAKG